MLGSTPNFIDHKQLQKFWDISKSPVLSTLIRSHIIYRPEKRINCQINPENKQEKEIFIQETPSETKVIVESDSDQSLEIESQPSQIGRFFATTNTSKISLKTPENRPRLYSLNLGSFGLDSLHNQPDTVYKQYLEDFVEYLKSIQSFAMICNLQDCPDDKKLFKSIKDLGFDIYYFPHIFYELGQFVDRPNAGLTVLINKKLANYDLNLLNISLNFQNGGFIDYHKAFGQYQTKDMLIKPLTVYFTFQNKQSKEIFLVANTHISPFSTQSNRLKSIQASVKILHQIIEQISKNKGERDLIVRFTGDFNFYGVNTQRAPFGLNSEPWSHITVFLSAIWSGFDLLNIFKSGKIFKLGKNKPNINETQTLKDWLKTKDFGIATDNYGDILESKTVLVNRYAPNWLSPIFSGAGTSWILDLCLYPNWSKKFHIWHDKSPFGEIDHETLVVQL